MKSLQFILHYSSLIIQFRPGFLTQLLFSKNYKLNILKSGAFSSNNILLKLIYEPWFFKKCCWKIIGHNGIKFILMMISILRGSINFNESITGQTEKKRNYKVQFYSYNSESNFNIYELVVFGQCIWFISKTK